MSQNNTHATPTASGAPFTDEQTQYLQGFMAGSGIAGNLANLPSFASMQTPIASAPKSVRPARPEDIHLEAQDRTTASGRKLVNEEIAKRTKHGLDIWDDVIAHARDGKFPKGTDVFLFKFMGMFYVAPAQDAFMCRLRFPGGVVKSHQLRAVAELAENYAGGYADVTTRANLQLREIGPKNTVPILLGLLEAGIINRGAGADNVRNVTATPTTGFDPHELIDVGPLARELHYHIINHRELYGLPRKFNVAFDSGGGVSVLEDTNDIGFAAVRVSEDQGVEPGLYFRMQLAGVTGHQQFAKDAGVLIRPDGCVSVAVAVIRAFIDHGDRTDRKKARLKYTIDAMGMDAFLVEVEKHLGRKLTRLSSDTSPLYAGERAGEGPSARERDSADSPSPCLSPEYGGEGSAPARAYAHVGVHPQKQDGLHYIGVTAPAARLSAAQLRALADISDEFGRSELRLTVWQNLLIPHIATTYLPIVKQRIEQAGLSWNPTGVRAGLVACTGNGGCKYAASNTKRHALSLADHIDAAGIALDQPLNIHLTGCPHSCAQHYIGDIGLLGTKVGDDAVEGYHIFVGGGFGAHQGIGKELYRDVIADEVPNVIEKMLRSYLEHRNDAGESFFDFTRRVPGEKLKEVFESSAVAET